MKHLIKLGASAVLVWLASPVATAQDAVAKVAQIIGEDETVVVIRQSDAFALRAGDDLFDGDRVIVRMATNVEIDGFDCTVSLQESQTLTVSANLCDEVAGLVSSSDLALVAPTTQGVGAAAPLWTLLAATGGPAVAAADALTNGNGVTEAGPIVAENTTESTSP